MARKEKRNLSTRLLGLLLSIVLLLGGFLSAAQPAYAQGRINRGKKVYTYSTHGRKEDSFSFSIGNGVVTIESIPQRLVAKAKYISADVSVTGKWENDKFVFQTPYKSIYSSQEVSAPHSIPLPTEEGVYSLSVHIMVTDGSPGDYTQTFFIKDGDAFFRLNTSYDKNEKIFKKRYTSKAALWAFTRPYYSDDKEKHEIIKQTAEKIVAPGDSDYEKVRKVHDWVANNIWYDLDYFQGRTDTTEIEPIEVLKSKKTICDGYSRLTMVLLRALGIPARYVKGSAGGLHAWNEVYVDGRWIIMDTTWDSHNTYKNGKYSEAEPCIMMYLDPSLEDFSDTHSIDEEDDNGYGQVWASLSSALPLETQKLTLKKGQTKKLPVKTLDKSLSLKDLVITYSSSNRKVATVSKSGKVKGLKAGTATIEVKIKIKELGKETLFRCETKVTVKKK